MPRFASSLVVVTMLGACGGPGANGESPGHGGSEATTGPAPEVAAPTTSSADLDGDDDRILDIDDRCPTEPETYNGIDDSDGCPDRGQVIVDDGIGHYGTYRALFRPNSANVRESADALLDAVVATLEGNARVERVACIGRAGPRERDPRGLSLARGGAVCQSLVDRGIDPGRLVAFGAGAADPLTEGDAFDPATERSVTLAILVVSGVEQNRWNGRTLETIAPADDDEREEVTITTHVDVYFDQIYFARDSAEVRAMQEPAVKAVTDGLRAAPDIERIACIGHAARGEQSPDPLSRARADAVCQLLVEHGIDAARLESRGVGTATPITGPGTGRPYDAERERRVEMRVLVEAGVER